MASRPPHLMASHPPRVAEGFPRQRLTVLPVSVLRRARELPLVGALTLTRIGAFAPAPSHYVRRENGDADHLLILCLAGSGRGTLGTRRWSLAAGDAVVLPPQVAHHYRATEADPWTILWVHFRGRDAARYVDAIGATRERPTFHLRSLDRLVEAFEETYRHTLGGFTDADLLGLTTSLARFLGLCRLYQQSANLRRRRIEDRVLATIRHMEKHYAERLTLDDLARVAHWSPQHYSTQFKRRMNASPIDHLTHLRLRRAADLLKFTDQSVGSIAGSVGYDDPFYFSRRFTGHMGLSPTAYRRRFGTLEPG